MRLGIDFGTSYSAAGAVVGDSVQLLTFGDEKQFRTTAYFQHQLPDPSQFALTPALEAEVDSLVPGSSGSTEQLFADQAGINLTDFVAVHTQNPEHAVAVFVVTGKWADLLGDLGAGSV